MVQMNRNAKCTITLLHDNNVICLFTMLYYEFMMTVSIRNHCSRGIIIKENAVVNAVFSKITIFVCISRGIMNL